MLIESVISEEQYTAITADGLDNELLLDLQRKLQEVLTYQVSTLTIDWRGRKPYIDPELLRLQIFEYWFPVIARMPYTEWCECVNTGLATSPIPVSQLDPDYFSGVLVPHTDGTWVLHRGNAQAHEPIATVAPLGVQHVQIPVPSGQLYVSDGIRIKQLESLIDTGKSINTYLGQQESTLCAANYGVFKYYTDNNPTIVKDLDKPTLYGTSADLSGVYAAQPKVQIDADVWQHLIVDREILLSLLSQDRPKAEAMLHDYLMDYPLETLQVEPGVLHCYYTYSGDEGASFITLAKPGYTVPQELSYILSSTPLQPMLDQQNESGFNCD